MKFKNKVIIITGGAGGIGRAIANAFAREGAKVFIIDRTLSNLKKVVKNIKTRGLNVKFLVGDISKLSDTKKIIRMIHKKEGKIDILINCAGIQAPIGPFIKNRLSEWERNIKINLLGTIFMTQSVLPFMIKERKGSIINFAGGGATSSRPNFSAYAVSKTGIVRFTEVVADEVKKYGIKINAVSPGPVNTAMTREILKAGDKAGNKELKGAKSRLKKGRASPEPAANLVMFLASAKSNGLTGKLISALWDKWQEWDSKDIKKITKSDIYTLRRIK